MTYNRYRLSFLLSILIFLILFWGAFTLFEKNRHHKKPKKETSIKVSLLAPVVPVKKIIKKVVAPTPKKTEPPKAIVKKVIKPKPKPKKVVKKS